MIFQGTETNAISIVQNGAGSSQVVTDIRIPATIALSPTSGTAQIDYSLDPTLSVWRVWTPGAVGVYTESTLSAPVAGLRLTVVSGLSTMRVVD